jgi:hypothetical protein
MDQALGGGQKKKSKLIFATKIQDPKLMITFMLSVFSVLHRLWRKQYNN